jgi:sec-independent protein translocase protein TatC
MAEKNDMSFLEHLEELRWKLVKSAIAIMVFASLAFIFKDFVFDTIILAPKNGDFITYRAFCKLGNLLGFGDKLCMGDVPIILQNIDMAGQFTTHIIVSLLSGIVIAFPFVFYQVWSFIAPGLKSGEKSVARGVVFYASFLFICGVLFGYYLISPLSVQFLGGYTVSAEVLNQISLSSYITTVSTISVATGFIFQLPLVIYFLSRLGLVTPEFLKKYRRHALVVVLILAAIITPPDVTSQILVAFPLLLLYEISIVISKRVQNNKL